MARLGKIYDELRCSSCGKKLSKKQTLFDTAWLGVYWCGQQECAYYILDGECEELDVDDPCNHEEPNY